MAKTATVAKEKTKPAAKKVAAKKTAANTSTEFKFGIPDLAKQMDIAEASVRVKLRNAGVEKAGKSYGWNSKSEMEAVAKSLKAAPKE